MEVSAVPRVASGRTFISWSRDGGVSVSVLARRGSGLSLGVSAGSVADFTPLSSTESPSGLATSCITPSVAVQHLLIKRVAFRCLTAQAHVAVVPFPHRTLTKFHNGRATR